MTTKKTTAKTQPKSSNARSGKKAHHDNRAYKVGRIRFGSWASKVLKVCDIVVYEAGLVHIYNYHNKELDLLGMTAIQYVSYIAKNYNEIRQGSGNSFLLCVNSYSSDKQSNIAAIELTLIDTNKTNVYEIKTAIPIKTDRLLKRKLLCANARRVSY